MVILAAVLLGYMTTISVSCPRLDGSHLPGELLLKHSAQVDLVTEEVEEGPEEHQEVVALPEEVAAEVQEVEVSSGQKEAQKPSS